MEVSDLGARCLDGSSAAFYYREGKNSDKFLIYFEDAEICGSDTLDLTLQKCSKIFDTDHGSSNNYPDEIYIKDGILSRNYLTNSFYNWNSVLIKSCDGTAFQGYDGPTQKYDNKIMYLRGGQITRTIISYLLLNMNLAKATDVVIAGGGQAGGLAVYIWANFIMKQLVELNPAISVKAIADAGIFLDARNMQYNYTLYKTQIKNLFNLVDLNYDFVNTPCLEKYISSQYYCLFGQNLLSFMEMDTFIVQSQYEQYSIQQVLGIACADDATLDKCSQAEKDGIESYRTNLLNIVNNILSLRSRWGAFMPACICNTLTDNDKFTSGDFKVGGTKLEAALIDWVKDPTSQNNVYIDSKPWPSNTGCSNK